MKKSEFISRDSKIHSYPFSGKTPVLLARGREVDRPRARCHNRGSAGGLRLTPWAGASGTTRRIGPAFSPTDLAQRSGRRDGPGDVHRVWAPGVALCLEFEKMGKVGPGDVYRVWAPGSLAPGF